MALYSISPANNNAVAGGLAHDIDRLLLRIQQYKGWLDTVTNQQLLDAGYVQGDIDILKSGIGDLDQLRVIYQGGAALPTAKDFRTFAKLMYPYGSLV